MTLAILTLILAPLALFTVVGVALDERYELTGRVATTRLGQWARTLITRHIDQ